MQVPLRFCTIYLAEGRAAVVAPSHYNLAGILYEQEEVLLVEAWRNDGVLADPLRQALRRFSFRERNLRDAKVKDWPSFRASNCKSVREFESSYLRLEVRAWNAAEAGYDASAGPAGESEISLHITLLLSLADEELSRRIIRLFDACRQWTARIGDF